MNYKLKGSARKNTNGLSPTTGTKRKLNFKRIRNKIKTEFQNLNAKNNTFEVSQDYFDDMDYALDHELANAKL